MTRATHQSARRRAIGSTLLALGLLAWASVSFAAGPAAASASASVGHASAASKKAPPAAQVKRIDINSASRTELETLPGIGKAEADKIIAGRPYLSKVHLVTESGIPAGVYQSIRHRIVAVQNKQAQAKLKAMAKARHAQQAEQVQPR